MGYAGKLNGLVSGSGGIVKRGTARMGEGEILTAAREALEGLSADRRMPTTIWAG
jgi:hypothetical protein